MKKLLLALTLLLASSATAAEIQFGPGVLTKANSITDVKHLAISEDWDIRPNVDWRLRVGYWVDNRKGAHDALYINPSIGLTVQPWIVDVRIHAGIAIISHTDIYLGGRAQFTEAVFIGIKDPGAYAGVECSHLSSAGIFKPNIGRNFCGIVAGIEF